MQKHPQRKIKERNSHCAYHVYTKANLIGDQDLSTSKALNWGCKLTDLGFSNSIGFLKTSILLKISIVGHRFENNIYYNPPPQKKKKKVETNRFLYLHQWRNKILVNTTLKPWEFLMNQKNLGIRITNKGEHKCLSHDLKMNIEH
jgi:hypothetical protein